MIPQLQPLSCCSSCAAADYSQPQPCYQCRSYGGAASAARQVQSLCRSCWSFYPAAAHVLQPTAANPCPVTNLGAMGVLHRHINCCLRAAAPAARGVLQLLRVRRPTRRADHRLLQMARHKHKHKHKPHFPNPPPPHSPPTSPHFAPIPPHFPPILPHFPPSPTPPPFSPISVLTSCPRRLALVACFAMPHLARLWSASGWLSCGPCRGRIWSALNLRVLRLLLARHVPASHLHLIRAHFTCFSPACCPLLICPYWACFSSASCPHLVCTRAALFWSSTTRSLVPPARHKGVQVGPWPPGTLVGVVGV